MGGITLEVKGNGSVLDSTTVTASNESGEVCYVKYAPLIGINFPGVCKCDDGVGWKSQFELCSAASEKLGELSIKSLERFKKAVEKAGPDPVTACLNDETNAFFNFGDTSADAVENLKAGMSACFNPLYRINKEIDRIIKALPK